MKPSLLQQLAIVVVCLGTNGVHRACAAEREEDEAARQQRFKELYESAGKAYGSGNYTAAIPSLQAAYALQPLPPLLFNIGQAYRKLEMWSEARVYLELYRRVHLDIPRERAAALDDLVIEARDKEREAHTPQVIEKTRLLYVAQEKPPPRWLRPVGVTAGILGLTAIGIGSWMIGIHGTCTQDPVPPALACEQVYATRAPGIGIAAAGGAALVLGTVSFALSFRKPAKPIVQQTPLLNDALATLEQSDLQTPKPSAQSPRQASPRPALGSMIVPAGSGQTEPPPAGTPEPSVSRVPQAIGNLDVPERPRTTEPPPKGFRASGRRSHH